MAVDPRRILVLPMRWRTACIVLAILPLPGLGTLIAGFKNPHTRLARCGAAQMVLVVFGSWPLVVPGVAGLAWACYSAWWIARYARPPPAWSTPVKTAP